MDFLEEIELLPPIVQVLMCVLIVVIAFIIVLSVIMLNDENKDK